jgi:uncharacterized surface protein with fasciclin (FAS1) repeats
VTPEPTATPSSGPYASVSDYLSNQESLSALAAAIADTGIDIDQMASEAASASLSGSFTLFAPSDDALSSLSASERDALLTDEDTLRRFLQHIFVEDAVYSVEFPLNPHATTSDGSTFAFSGSGQEVMVTDQSTQETAVVTIRDVIAGVGLVQVINEALLPASE